MIKKNPEVNTQNAHETFFDSQFDAKKLCVIINNLFHG